MRRDLPRFGEQTAAQNEAVVASVRDVAARHGCEPAQIALAWVRAQSDRLGVPVVPIPGTKRRRWLEQNVAALDISLDAEDRALLDGLADRVAGTRY